MQSASSSALQSSISPSVLVTHRGLISGTKSDPRDAERRFSQRGALTLVVRYQGQPHYRRMFHTRARALVTHGNERR
ncbi:unnamed protein product [Lampetra planeri]